MHLLLCENNQIILKIVYAKTIMVINYGYKTTQKILYPSQNLILQEKFLQQL
jgi:hypothetical protein